LGRHAEDLRQAVPGGRLYQRRDAGGERERDEQLRLVAASRWRWA